MQLSEVRKIRRDKEMKGRRRAGKCNEWTNDNRNKNESKLLFKQTAQLLPF